MDFKKHCNKLKNIFGLGMVIAQAKFKLKNEGSYLGIFWYLLNPILTFTILFLIFADRLGNSIVLYPLYLLLGIIVFNFFQNATTEASGSIQASVGMIKSIKFSTISLIVGVMFKNIFSHFFEVVLFFTVCTFFGLNIFGIFYYILLFIPFSCFVFGVCLILSSLNVYFADIGNMWVFFTRILWLVTPTFYSIGGQTRLFYLNLFNPMYYFITIFRDIIIYNKVPNGLYFLAAIGSSLLFLVVGLVIFNKFKHKFAELI